DAEGLRAMHAAHAGEVVDSRARHPARGGVGPLFGALPFAAAPRGPDRAAEDHAGREDADLAAEREGDGLLEELDRSRRVPACRGDVGETYERQRLDVAVAVAAGELEGKLGVFLLRDEVSGPSVDLAREPGVERMLRPFGKVRDEAVGPFPPGRRDRLTRRVAMSARQRQGGAHGSAAIVSSDEHRVRALEGID